jgi:hypothetical protein
MNPTLHGTVLAVTRELAGDALAAAATATDEVLYLDDVSEFDEDGGQATVTDAEDDSITETVTYSAVDSDGESVTLVDPLVNSYTVGSLVLLYPEQRDRYAYVQPDDPDLLPVQARVPHALKATVPLGQRADEPETGDTDNTPGEEVIVELQRDEWVVTDVLRQDPVIDGSYIDQDPDRVFRYTNEDGLAAEGQEGEVISGYAGTLTAAKAVAVDPAVTVSTWLDILVNEGLEGILNILPGETSSGRQAIDPPLHFDETDEIRIEFFRVTTDSTIKVFLYVTLDTEDA